MKSLCNFNGILLAAALLFAGCEKSNTIVDEGLESGSERPATIQTRTRQDVPVSLTALRFNQVGEQKYFDEAYDAYPAENLEARDVKAVSEAEITSSGLESEEPPAINKSTVAPPDAKQEKDQGWNQEEDSQDSENDDSWLENYTGPYFHVYYDDEASTDSERSPEDGEEYDGWEDTQYDDQESSYTEHYDDESTDTEYYDEESSGTEYYDDESTDTYDETEDWEENNYHNEEGGFEFYDDESGDQENYDEG